MITSICENVIWYEYKGDEVCWNGEQYISLMFASGFSTLEDIDKLWNDYYEALKNHAFDYTI